jgi:hypothetical protein
LPDWPTLSLCFGRVLALHVHDRAWRFHFSMIPGAGLASQATQRARSDFSSPLFVIRLIRSIDDSA